ncbi:DUF3781 domain-containing protein [Plebeiibacterium sediminum]|uniref:DUF3781 domain-containing protein n=1 Tax=Plebeiibacterium sediminum TaxID=2992112 RepID=A0AAE3M829_9BACT|nr:DUF3781 domain-containing protein [Plebeiobacterium sediminum]MCW3788899.1 DUF3781 domain-containing protein [Plebeiobacterium sediminum]
MTNTKRLIIENLCYTELVYQRINKKLATDLSKVQIEQLIDTILKKTSEASYIKTGKNYYVTSSDDHIRITINSNTFRVITVDRLRKV